MLNYMNLIVVIYQGSNMPLCRRYQNWIELWNEFWIQMATYNLMLFTDYVITNENKYMYGWSFIVIMMMHIFLSFITISYFIINSLKLIWIRYVYKKWYLKIFLPWFLPKWHYFREKYLNFPFIKRKFNDLLNWLDLKKRALFDWTYLKYPHFTDWIKMNFPDFFDWFSSGRFNPEVIPPERELVKFYRVKEN